MRVLHLTVPIQTFFYILYVARLYCVRFSVRNFSPCLSFFYLTYCAYTMNVPCAYARLPIEYTTPIRVTQLFSTTLTHSGIVCHALPNKIYFVTTLT